MKKFFLAIILAGSFSNTVWGQATFKAGWNTYNTRMIIHEYNYNMDQKDSLRLSLIDSCKTFVSPDSLVTMNLSFSSRDKAVYKTVTYLNAKKQLLKTESYKNDNLQEVNEWKYDDKNRKILYLTDNKLTGNLYKKTYDYAGDRKSGDFVVTESAYYNGKIEFYTKSYYDKNMVKYKEVRLNDNNKDIIHVETYTYGENGKVKERSVYFPEFKVTKKFAESEGNQLPKCFRTMPVGIADKMNPTAKSAYIKRVLAKNQAVMSEAGCHDYEYKFSNFSNCEITVATTKVNNGKRLRFCYMEKY